MCKAHVTCLRLHVSAAMYAKINMKNENKYALRKAVVSSMAHLYRVCFNPYSEDWCSSIITVNTVKRQMRAFTDTPQDGSTQLAIMLLKLHIGYWIMTQYINQTCMSGCIPCYSAYMHRHGRLTSGWDAVMQLLCLEGNNAAYATAQSLW